jgi:hypothetical protein
VLHCQCASRTRGHRVLCSRTETRLGDAGQLGSAGPRNAAGTRMPGVPKARGQSLASTGIGPPRERDFRGHYASSAIQTGAPTARTCDIGTGPGWRCPGSSARACSGAGTREGQSGAGRWSRLRQATAEAVRLGGHTVREPQSVDRSTTSASRGWLVPARAGPGRWRRATTGFKQAAVRPRAASAEIAASARENRGLGAHQGPTHAPRDGVLGRRVRVF